MMNGEVRDHLLIYLSIPSSFFFLHLKSPKNLHFPTATRYPSYLILVFACSVLLLSLSLSLSLDPFPR